MRVDKVVSNAELKEILQRIAEKDNAAFDDLYKGYSKVIFGIALSLLKNEENSHDVVQLVMSKLYTMSKEKFPTSHELTWFYTVTKNEALQFIRKEHINVPLDNILNMVSGTDELSHAIDMDAYRDMIKSLDEQSQAIVTLKVIAGFSHKEIGKMLHMPTGTVQWKYHVAVNKLRIAITNFVLFVMFGLGDLVFISIIKSRPQSAPSRPEGVSGVIDVPVTDIIFYSLTALALLMLIIAITFFIKYFKIRQQKRRPNVSK